MDKYNEHNVRVYVGSLTEFHGLPVVSSLTCKCPRCTRMWTDTRHAIHVDDTRESVVLWKSNCDTVRLNHVRRTSFIESTS